MRRLNENGIMVVENKLEESQIPEIWETEEDKWLSDSKLKNNYFLWALQNLRGKTFLNKSTGKNIRVSRDGLGEWRSSTKSRDQIISIKMLGNLLEIARYWKERPHVPPDPNIEKVMYFRQHCRINDNDYCAIITVKVYKSNNDHKYYHHYLDDIILEPQK